nr:hypothetical protein Iba_chr04cCG17750 [Ipomoea batatas]
MSSSDLWIIRRRHFSSDHSLFCPVKMTAKFCSNAFERIISRKISWTHKSFNSYTSPWVWWHASRPISLFRVVITIRLPNFCLGKAYLIANCNPHTMLKMSYDLCIIISLFNQSGLPQSSHAHHRVNPQIIINSAKKEFNKRLLGIFKTYQIRFFWNTGIPSAIQLLVVNSCCWQDWLILGVFADSGLDLLQCKCKPVLSSQVLVFVLHLSEESSTSVATSKAEQEFVKNIFGVISQLPDYLHPSFNLRIHFFPLVSNS